MKRAHRTPRDVTVHVKGRNMAVSPGLHDLVVAKMGKLDKYLDRLSKIEVELWTEETRVSAHHNHVEATARAAGKTLRVESSGPEMHVAVDDAVDKLYRQLNRHKERLKTHHGTKLSTMFEEPESAAALSPDDLRPQTGSPIIHLERLDMKPQFEDEAVQELERGERDFYVFLNAKNEQVNVLYKVGDGSYGLIEPIAR
ncbi:MAG TPA: ribosome-associated translation inhibitor RaiA [Chloroflexota bacterium]|nr:ribosome-associated translation inhibitor RaiA [Chloroflexota bacterium]